MHLKIDVSSESVFCCSVCVSVLSHDGAWIDTAATAKDSVDIVVSSLPELQRPTPLYPHFIKATFVLTLVAWSAIVRRSALHFRLLIFRFKQCCDTKAFALRQ